MALLLLAVFWLLVIAPFVIFTKFLVWVAVVILYVLQRRR